MKFPSAGKQLSTIYIKHSARISLVILRFWFTQMSELGLFGTGSIHGFTWTSAPVLFLCVHFAFANTKQELDSC